MDVDDDRGDLFLSDDRPPTRSRPRWVDGLGLAAILLGMVAVGVLGDRSDSGTTSRPTTTTTESAFRRGAPYDQTTTTASTIPPSTTTSTLQFGPALLLATDTALLLVTGSTALLVDVDAGRAVRAPFAGPFGAVGVDEGFVVPAEGRYRVVSPDGTDVRTIDRGADRSFQLLRSGPHSIWVVQASDERPDGQSVIELDTTGRPTGRAVVLPAGTYLAGAVDGGLVAIGSGSIVVIDPDTNRRRSLGTGEVAVAGGRYVLRTSCPLLACRTELVDVRTGQARPLPDLRTSPGYLASGAFSPDGSHLAVSVVDPTGQSSLSVIETRSGRGWRTDEVSGEAPVAFSVDGRVVFSTDSGSLCAFEVATAERHCFTGMDASAVRMIAVARSR